MSHFHQRFQLPLGLEEARTRFVNRVFNQILEGLPFETAPRGQGESVVRAIVSALGRRYTLARGRTLSRYVNNDFLEALRAIEAFHAVAPRARVRLGWILATILAQSEVDLGVRWQDGKFLPTGAELLDEAAVNDPLAWLRQSGYPTVIQPFEKALQHFIAAQAKPELHSDVVTDAYEALEALAKIVTGKNRDLSANRELFISKIRAGEFQKNLLGDYVEYGCEFRHAASGAASRPHPSRAQTEFFLYQTGIFIRLAIPR